MRKALLPLVLLLALLPVSAAVADLRCVACGEPIVGQYAQTDRGAFHPEHLLCGGCGQPIRGQYFESDSAILCQDCRDKRLPVCEACGGRIKTEGIETAFGTYHLEHFTCAGCRQALKDAKYLEKNNKPWCRACYEDRFLEKCGICGAPLRDEALKDAWGNAFCARHARELPRCDSCGRLVSRALTGGGETFEDGRVVCGICARSAVRDSAMARRLLVEAADGLARQGLFSRDAGRMTLRLVGKEEVQERGVEGSGRMKGRTLVETKIVDGREVSRNVTQIRILHGLPAEEFSSVAAHELVHAELAESGYPELPKKVEEGLCELGSFLWLSSRIGDYPAYLMDRKVRNEDPVYGDGFRAALDGYRRMGMGELLKYVRKQKKLP